MLNLIIHKLATWIGRVTESFVVIWSVASLKYLLYLYMKGHLRDFITGIYRVSQEERAILREGVP